MWAHDFLTARTHDGRVLQILVVVDEYSRESLAMIVARRSRALEVLETLADLFLTHGVPAYLPVGPRAGVYGGTAGPDVVYRTGQSLGERLCGIV